MGEDFQLAASCIVCLLFLLFCFHFLADDDRKKFTLKIHHGEVLEESEGIVSHTGGQVFFLD